MTEFFNNINYNLEKLVEIVSKDLNKKDRVLLFLIYKRVKGTSGVKYINRYSKIVSDTYNLRKSLLEEHFKYRLFYYENKKQIKKEAYKLLVINPRKKSLRCHCKGKYYELFVMLNDHPLRNSHWIAKKLKKSNKTVLNESYVIFRILYNEGSEKMKFHINLLSKIIFGRLHNNRNYG